jgi:hypothetical protein
MNLKNLELLAEWLEAGAPHMVFDMKVGLADLQSDESVYDATSCYDVGEYLENRGISNNTCRTAGCMAGAAVMLSNAENRGNWPGESVEAKLLKNLGWKATQREALQWLGLESEDLFDMNLSPQNCTPAQAAVAVRNVMNGKEPWDV